MNTYCKRGVTAITALLGLLLVTTCLSAGTPMPEFGKSVQFDKTGPTIVMSQLKGKAVLVIFFQSWCGICNGWAPDLIKQLEDAHGGNRALVMLAIKTDGGGVTDAREYLKSKGADLNKWWVGSDEDAAFYKKIDPKNALWGYALVGATGDIVKQGKAGSFWSSGPNKGKYSLAAGDLLKDCGTLETILPPNKKYPSELDTIVRLAEVGCLGKALSLCASAGRLSQAAAAAQKDLKQDILLAAETRMKARMDTLKDAKTDGGRRYEAYKELTVLVKDCAAVPVAREAQTLLTKAGADPVIQKEKTAEAAYVKALQNLQKAITRDKPRVLKELEMVAKKYEGTLYGQRAGEECLAHQP
jgi:hypothetical protein